MEGLLPIFGPWSRHRRRCRDRDGVHVLKARRLSAPCAQQPAIVRARAHDMGAARTTSFPWPQAPTSIFMSRHGWVRTRLVLGRDIIFLLRPGLALRVS